jgi:amino-acid N-acetyltransferase
MPELRQVQREDLHRIIALLAESDLPTEDLGEDKLDGFLIAEYDGQVIGLIGLETFGTTGLLRSLVVAREARSGGLGGKLVGALESAAQAAGIRELWLLTIDAEKFFQRQGFTVVEREAVPESIRATEEFSALCPASAFLMMKRLDD